MTSPAPTAPAPLLMSAKDVAALLSIGLRTAYDLIYAGEFERKDIGAPGSKHKALRVTTASVHAYLERL